MDKIYILDILVETIKVEGSPQDVPSKEDISVTVTFGNLISMEISTDAIPVTDTQGEPSAANAIQFDSGKSVVFTYPSDRLLQLMKEFPLTIIVNKQDETLGMAQVPWFEAFVYMVESTAGYSTSEVYPISLRDEFELLSTNGKTGSVVIFIRLSCFAKNIISTFQIIEPEKPSQNRIFYFKCPTRETIIQAQKYGLGRSSEAIMVAPLYVVPGRVEAADSYETVLNVESAIKFSVYSQFRHSNILGEEQPTPVPALTIEGLRKVLCRNPDCPGYAGFKEFGIDIQEKQGKEKKLKRRPSDNIPIDHELSHATGKFDYYGPGNPYRRPKRVGQPFIPKQPVPIIPDDPGKCKYKPSLKPKCLKSVGCDPLRLKGGTPFDYEELPSFSVPSPTDTCKDLFRELDECLQAYRDALGPCGVPTCPYNAHFMRQLCKKTCHFKSDSVTTIVTNGTGTIGFDYDEAEGKSFASSSGKSRSPRSSIPGSKGTGSVPESKGTSSVPGSKATGSIPGSKDTSSIPGSKATGSIPGSKDTGSIPGSKGTTSIPGSKDTEHDKPLAFFISPYGIDEHACDCEMVSACGVANCPHARMLSQDVEREFKLSQIRTACGSPGCLYSKKRIGKANDDDMVFLQHLGLKLEKSCGKPECPYPVPEEIPLPPIHWDCPEPLPDGVCKNPDCPFLPPLLKLFKPKPPDLDICKPSTPCGSPICPYCYAIPCPPCGNPCCPYCSPCPPPYPPCGNPCCPYCTSVPCTEPPCSPPPCPPPPCPPPPCPPPPCPPPPCSPPPCPPPCPPPPCPPPCSPPPCPPPCPPPPCSPPPCPPPCPPPPCPPPCSPPPCPPPCPPPPCPPPCPPPPCPPPCSPCPPPCPPCGNACCPYCTQSPPCFPPLPSSTPTCPSKPCAPCPPLLPSMCGNPCCPYCTKDPCPPPCPPVPTPKGPCPCCMPPPPPPPRPKIICDNPECVKRGASISETVDEVPRSNAPCKVAEPPCVLPKDDSTDSAPCRNPNCPFRRKDNVCINPRCMYNKNAAGYAWCGDPTCVYHEEKKSDDDFCAKMVCPKFSFVGFLYK